MSTTPAIKSGTPTKVVQDANDGQQKLGGTTAIAAEDATKELRPEDPESTTQPQTTFLFHRQPQPQPQNQTQNVTVTVFARDNITGASQPRKETCSIQQAFDVMTNNIKFKNTTRKFQYQIMDQEITKQRDDIDKLDQLIAGNTEAIRRLEEDSGFFHSKTTTLRDIDYDVHHINGRQFDYDAKTDEFKVMNIGEMHIQDAFDKAFYNEKELRRMITHRTKKTNKKFEDQADKIKTLITANNTLFNTVKDLQEQLNKLQKLHDGKMSILLKEISALKYGKKKADEEKKPKKADD